MGTPVSGFCDPAFEVVREAFVENFASRGEVGAGVCVMVDGRPVVDLVGGWADAQCTREWTPDTIVNFYSAGKALVALTALRAIDSGLLSLDAPVAHIWPEFAAHGKHTATIRHALSHQAGVPAIRRRLTNDHLWRWEEMADAVADTAPWFEPGSRVVYHTNTYGHLVGEIARRTTGRTPGMLLRELAEPLGADLWWGVPTDVQRRCADVIWAPATPHPTIDLDALDDNAFMVFGGYFNPPGYSSHDVVNSTAWRSAQVPSTNGHGSATGLARVYSALATDRPSLLSTHLLAEAVSVQARGHCPVLGEEVAFGLGFVPTSERRPLGRSGSAFGHFGTGGALGFADPEARVGFGYVMNHVVPRWQSTRNRALIDAVYSVI